MTYATNAVGVAMHPFGLQMTCQQGQSEHHQGHRMKSEMSARAGLFNLAQLRFLTEAVDATFLGEKMRKQQLSWLNTVCVQFDVI